MSSHVPFVDDIGCTIESIERETKYQLAAGLEEKNVLIERLKRVRKGQEG